MSFGRSRIPRRLSRLDPPCARAVGSPSAPNLRVPRALISASALGVNVLEILTLAEFPGAFGWGYDGVLPFAPTRLYGRPDDVRRFVDEAHRLGIAVILDVVDSHCGPDPPLSRPAGGVVAGSARPSALSESGEPPFGTADA